MYITDIVYLLDVLVVIVYMSYCNCWDYLLLHEDWGECSEDWAGACRWGGEVEYLTEIFFGGGASFFSLLKFVFQKCSWGSETSANKNLFFGGGGDFGVFGAPHAPTRGRAGSENNTLLSMTMTCDRLKFWSGPAWRSKVIIRKPWRRNNKKNFFFFFFDKTIRHSRRKPGMPNYTLFSFPSKNQINAQGAVTENPGI